MPNLCLYLLCLVEAPATADVPSFCALSQLKLHHAGGDKTMKQQEKI